MYLSPTEHLMRASMALRGVRPALADLKAVAADPAKLPQIVDRYLQSPELGATVRDLHNEVLLLRTERSDLTPAPVGGLSGRTFVDLGTSFHDEPLRLIEDVVMTDQPYTTIVTADYTMADPIVATMYGLPHSQNDAWERVPRFGRPAAGILASDAFHYRYRSAGTNFHRGRANAVSRALLCHDFLDGDIQVDARVNLADPDAVSHAVVDNPSCAGCHQTLDPLASYFYAFDQGPIRPDAASSYPSTIYHPENAATWLFATGRPPSYFGENVTGLAGLGQAIAADPRFARCAAIHFASYLTEVPAAQLDPQWIAELQGVLEDSGMRAKALARAIVLSDRFRVAYERDPGAAELLVGYQKVRPAQLARMLEDLTGYRWSAESDAMVGDTWRTGRIDYLEDDYNGFRVLAGGIDSFLVTQPVHTMNATSSMVTRLAAYRAAEYVVDHDAAAAPDARTLLRGADVAATDEASVRANLAYLQARIFGDLDGDTDDTYRLFSGALAQSGDAKRAWIVTLTGMLSDLKAVYY